MEIIKQNSTKGMKRVEKGVYQYRGVRIYKSDAYRNHWEWNFTYLDGTTKYHCWEGLSTAKWFIDQDLGE